MLIQLTQNHFGSASQDVPEIKLVNMYLTPNPLSPDGVSYITRPVLTESVAFEGEVIRGAFYQQGFIDDQILVVVDSSLYKVSDDGVSTFIGEMSGVGVCRFAATIYHIAILSGEVLYLFDGNTLTKVDIPDSGKPSDITSLNNYFIISIDGTTRYYWIAPGETEVDPLDFASAESNPDDLISVKVISDEVWLIGKEVTQVSAVSGDDAAPFVPISGRVFNTGCVAASTSVQALKEGLPCLMWVSNNREVILAQGQPNKVSNEYIEEVLRASSEFYAWYFRRNRNDFYVLTTDVATLVYDISFNKWYKWSSYESLTWKASGGVQKNEKLFGFSMLKTPSFYTIADGVKDVGTDWLVCELTGFVPNTSRTPLRCDYIDLWANPGFGSTYDSSPLVELRFSDDQGANWSAYRQTDLGDRGATNSVVSFRSLGIIRQPGRRFEFRFSGVDTFRLDYVMMNDNG